MTAPKRVQRHRKAEAARRRVRTVGTQRIGTRTTIPRQKAPAAKRPAYRGTAGGAGFSAMLGALFFATGSIFWAVGAVTTSVGTAVVARIEYRRELAQVKATGRPIGTKAPAQAAASTDGLSEIREPLPVDLDAPPRGPQEAQHQAQQRHARTKSSPCARCGGRGTVTAQLKGGYTQQTPCPMCGAGRLGPRQPPPSRAVKTPGSHGPPGHDATCTAKTKEACPYWRKANPGRTGVRKTTRKRTTK